MHLCASSGPKDRREKQPPLPGNYSHRESHFLVVFNKKFSRGVRTVQSGSHFPAPTPFFPGSHLLLSVSRLEDPRPSLDSLYCAQYVCIWLWLCKRHSCFRTLSRNSGRLYLSERETIFYENICEHLYTSHRDFTWHDIQTPSLCNGNDLECHVRVWPPYSHLMWSLFFIRLLVPRPCTLNPPGGQLKWAIGTRI